MMSKDLKGLTNGVNTLICTALNNDFMSYHFQFPKIASSGTTNQSN